MKSSSATVLTFADLLDPRLALRADADGAEIVLTPAQDLAHDAVIEAGSRYSTASEWDAEANRMQDAEYIANYSALCRARAQEARRIGRVS